MTHERHGLNVEVKPQSFICLGLTPLRAENVPREMYMFGLSWCERRHPVFARQKLRTLLKQTEVNRCGHPE